ADFGGLVLFAGLLRLQNPDELVPLAALGIKDLEVVPASEREVLLLHRLLCLAIVGIEGQKSAPRRNGAFVVVESVPVDCRQLAENLDPLAVVGSDLRLLLQHRRESGKVLGPFVETGQVSERLAVLRVRRENLLP